MSTLYQPQKAQFFISCLFCNSEALSVAHLTLQEVFENVQPFGEVMPFDKTVYYNEEMGHPIYRQIFSLSPLLSPEALVGIKLTTNSLERRWAFQGKRKFNLDPGYLDAAKLLLATGKNFAHRIYLEAGVFADLTLVYQRGEFQKLPWTYPDYASTEMRQLFKQLRQDYMMKLRGKTYEEDFSVADQKDQAHHPGL